MRNCYKHLSFLWLLLIGHTTLLAQGSGGLDVSKALSWLPHDTETVIGANRGWTIPKKLNASDEADENDRKLTDEEISNQFQSLPLGLFSLKDGILLKHLAGKRVRFALEGSRHFRAPNGLGEMPYEGCAIAVFESKLASAAADFRRASEKLLKREEQIEGNKVSVFEEKLEDDLWTTYVAFPTEHVVVVASNRDYLREVLSRISGQEGQRALPPGLPEWKYVPKESPYWAVRHYDRTQQENDPTSPFGGPKSAYLVDEHAIGIAFSFDPSRSRIATITYLSENPDLAPGTFTSRMLPTEPMAKGLRPKADLLRPGVVQITCQIEGSEATSYFFFVLEGALGHATYL